MSWVVRFVVMLLLVVGITSNTAQAQYTVQNGDNLWELAGKNLDSASAWEKIYQANSFLQAPGRRFVIDGRTIVVIKPGEVLRGLNEFGIVPSAPADLKPEDLGKDSPKTVREIVAVKEFPWWLLWMLAVLAVLIIWLIARHRRVRDGLRLANNNLRERNQTLRDHRDYEDSLNRNPVTSGEPIIPGGVTLASASARFQEMASRRWESETDRLAPPQVFTIQRITAGRGWGIMNVSYADGSEEARRLRGERVYEADVLFPDGKTETLYMLQGCGNDLRYGGVHRYTGVDGFRFEPDSVQPAVPVAPATVPNVVVSEANTSSTDAVKDGHLRLEVRLAADSAPNLIKVTGIRQHGGVTVDASGDLNEVTVRIFPRK